MIYIKILLLAIALFTFLRFTALHLPKLLENKKLKILVIRLFPAIELFVWLGFIIYSSSIIFGNFAAFSVIMTFIVVIIMAILSWYLLRDFVSGFILRAENGFEPGDVVKTSFVQGTIKKVGYRSIEIITSNGEYVKIPYTMLINTAVTKPQDHSKWVENVVSLEVTTSLDTTKVKSMLKKSLMEMPWIVSEESIKIEIKLMNANSLELHGSVNYAELHGSANITELIDSVPKYIAAIHFYSITPETAIKTQENLKKFIDENIN